MKHNERVVGSCVGLRGALLRCLGIIIIVARVLILWVMNGVVKCRTFSHRGITNTRFLKITIIVRSVIITLLLTGSRTRTGASFLIMTCRGKLLINLRPLVGNNSVGSSSLWTFRMTMLG